MKNKTILLITPLLFHYHERIKDELENRGAKVIFFPDQPQGALTALKRKLSSKVSKKYYNNLLDQIKEIEFDYFFLINGKGITREFIKSLKNQNKQIKLITYQWDSIARSNKEIKSNFLYFIDLFDKCFSFDYQDSSEVERLEYLPTFHTIDQNIDREKIRSIDFLMVASYTDERYEFIKRRVSERDNMNLNFHFHLYIPWHHYARNLFLKGKFMNPGYLKFHTLSKEKLDELYLNSKATIDIQYIGQTGFTMRVMEGLAFGCKIITTNKKITKERFYRSDEILVFETPFFWEYVEKNYINGKTKPNKLMNDLHIKKWIERIFD